MHLHGPISGKCIVGRQGEGLVAPNLREGVLVNPTLIHEINASGIFDDFEEAAFPLPARLIALNEGLSFSAYLSSIDAEFGYFLGRPFGKKMSPGSRFFQGSLVPGQAFKNLNNFVSDRLRL